jgi:prepilin-type N-terminal cleavage/methylation domain-containing protein
MKRQLDTGKSGFTLFELMLVISIIGIFTVIAMRINWNPRSDAEKADLLSVAIA